MRLQLASDLHFEFHADAGAALAASIPVAGDVLVLAGDVTPVDDVRRVEARLRWFTDRFAHVVWVAGNHEFYGTSGPAAEDAMATLDARIANLHVLDGAAVTIDGARIVGATLWFPSTDGEEALRPFLNDFRHIRGAVPWIRDTHARHAAYLEREVRAGDVVVTHHLPHAKCVPAQFANHALNRFFVAPDVSPLVETRGAAVWLHGHTHLPVDEVAGTTRLLCNPYGYPAERPNLPPFRADLVLEVHPPAP